MERADADPRTSSGGRPAASELEQNLDRLERLVVAVILLVAVPVFVWILTAFPSGAPLWYTLLFAVSLAAFIGCGFGAALTLAGGLLIHLNELRKYVTRFRAVGRSDEGAQSDNQTENKSGNNE
jgi:hypothetical protein